MNIVFGSGITFTCPEQVSAQVSTVEKDREWKKIDVIGTADDVKSAFVNDAAYSQEWESETETGTETLAKDLSEYSIAGDIVDHRDGTITVYMGKPTDTETLLTLLYGGI